MFSVEMVFGEGDGVGDAGGEGGDGVRGIVCTTCLCLGLEKGEGGKVVCNRESVGVCTDDPSVSVLEDSPSASSSSSSNRDESGTDFDRIIFVPSGDSLPPLV